MKYVQPIGAAENASYVDANPASGIEGSAVPASAIENPQREIEAVISGAGLIPASGDLTQLRQAIIKMIQSGQRSVVINAATFAPAVTGTGKPVYWDAGNARFDLAVADGSAKQNCVGFADVPNGQVVCFGDAALFAGLTPGSRYYLDVTTAGVITTTAAGVYLGIARSASELFVDIDEGVSVNQANAFTKGQRGAETAIPATSGTVTLDLPQSNNWGGTLTGNIILTNPSNMPVGQSGVIRLVNAGPYTIAYGAYWKPADGTTLPALTATVGANDALIYYVETATRILVGKAGGAT